MQTEPIGPEIPVARAMPPARFERLVFAEARSLSKGRRATLAVSVGAHSLGIAALIILPILFADVLSAPDDGVRAFFVAPVLPAPPPPPPPAPGAGAVARHPAAQQQEPSKLAASVGTPPEAVAEEGIALSLESGVSGGVEGGVPGGVPGGVVGGIVGGLPEEAPPPTVVRVGGVVKAPKQLRRVEPEYPPLAQKARLGALIILEATVDTSGRVREVAVLRGHPLFNDAAVAAVRQWVYAPLLLDGVPREFSLTVTVSFDLMNAPAPAI